MKKTVIVFGLIAGLIVSSFMLFSMTRLADNPDMDHSMWIGYTSMIIAFSFVFVGIRNYRDKYNEGTISFGKAFKTGFFISLIASTMYVVVWLIYYYNFAPDFMDKYSSHVIESMKKEGAPAAEIDAQVAEMAMFKEWYKSPVMVVLLTYVEILPVGLIITLISALILKRREKVEEVATL